MRRGFIVSTTNSLEGYEIRRYYGICSERVVIGAGLFSEFFAGLTDVFGGRSSAFEAQLKEMYDAAMDKLISSAVKKGANGLVGVKMDIDEISGKGTQMFMISVSGTAVLIKDLMSREEVNSVEESNVLSRFAIENQIKTKELTGKLEKCRSLASFKELINEAIYKNIMIPLDVFIAELNNTEREFTQFQSAEKLYEYLDLYDRKHLNDKLSKTVLNSNSFTNMFIHTYAALALPDYKYALQYLDKVDIEIIEELILPVLLKYKDSYDNDDITDIQLICDKLNKLLSNDVINTTKGMFNKEVWICTCGKKVPINELECSSCHRYKNGLSSEQDDLIRKTVDFLTGIKEVFDNQYD